VWRYAAALSLCFFIFIFICERGFFEEDEDEEREGDVGRGYFVCSTSRWISASRPTPSASAR
jgi:hypothetical protein